MRRDVCQVCLKARPLNSLLSDVWICYFLTSHLNETHIPLKGKKLVTLISLKAPAQHCDSEASSCGEQGWFGFFFKPCRASWETSWRKLINEQLVHPACSVLDPLPLGSFFSLLSLCLMLA